MRSKKLLVGCRGKPCYLGFPGCTSWNTHASHSNDSRMGRGIGLKSGDEYTLPACPQCHYTYDYGKDFSREEKRERWEAGFARWRRDRAQVYGIGTAPVGVPGVDPDGGDRHR